MSRKLVVSMHQADVFPNARFFWKMCHSNIMDLGYHDKFNKGSDRYHHRVKIGRDDNPSWLTLPVEFHSGYLQKDVLIKPEMMMKCFRKLETVYSGYKMWDTYKESLYQLFSKYENGGTMFSFNLESIQWVKDQLNIDTPIAVTTEGKGSTTTERIATQLMSYAEISDNIEYLSGQSGKEYLEIDIMKDMMSYAGSELSVRFMEYTPPEGYNYVSVLTIMMDHNPDEVVKLLGLWEYQSCDNK